MLCIGVCVCVCVCVCERERVHVSSTETFQAYTLQVHVEEPLMYIYMSLKCPDK